MKKIIVILGILLIFSTKAIAEEFDFSDLFHIKFGMQFSKVENILKKEKIEYSADKNQKGITFKTYNLIYEAEVEQVQIHFTNKKVNFIYLKYQKDNYFWLKNLLKFTSNCMYDQTNVIYYLFDNCIINEYPDKGEIYISKKDKKIKCE